MKNAIEKIDLDCIDWRSSRDFFESLGNALDKLDGKNESYNFTWVGKRKSIIEAGMPINKTLRPDIEASKDFDNTKNMLIVGDNLDALKLLQESYLNRIKLIYIDPPYNTGSDFIYCDDFATSAEEYTDSSFDESGSKVVAEDPMRENSRANGRFHSDWLSMIYPRLKIARNLLSEDGVIFISIDDSEQSNMKKVCDEVFGEENFISCIVNQSANSVFGTKAAHKDKTFVKVKDYILVYRKTPACIIKPLYTPSKIYIYDSHEFIIDDNKRYSTTEWFEAKYKPIFDKYGQKINKQSIQRIMEFDEAFRKEVMDQLVTKQFGTWPYTKKDFSNEELEKLRNGEIIEHNGLKIIQEGNGTGLIRFLRTLGDSCQLIDGEYRKCDILGDVWNNAAGYGNINAEGDIKFPNGKKPLLLLDKIISSSTDDDSIVLDFFAGSGSTGHAVLEKNVADGGNRKYILVQWPEKTNGVKEFETVDQITAERLRRAGKKIDDEHPGNSIDTGFRVYRIDDNNENDGTRKPLNEINQSDLFGVIDNVKKDRTPLDLLFGVVYISALPFDLKLETRKFGDNTVYLYGYLDEGTGLVACFDDNIPEETIKEIANLKALTAAFKDSSFADSAAKINLSEHFRVISPNTKVKVI